jgi:hypothetical protein
MLVTEPTKNEELTLVDYIEAQKRVIDAYFNSAVWIPYVENNYRMYSYLFSPKIPAVSYLIFILLEILK